jgi:ATP-dependent helicase/nuclease subunit A
MKAWIQAGAGTGKTTKVVGLLLQRLLATETEPSRLLALTFTVRAANEMRDRLGTWLARLVQGGVIAELGGGLELFDERELAARRGRRALAELDRIEIGTIHSFAAHLLRQYPVEAGVSPTFVEDDGAAEASLFREMWGPWLDTRLGESGQVDVVAGFLERFEIHDLRAFAAALCKEGLRLEINEEPERRREWAGQLAAAAADTEKLIATCAEDGRARGRRLLETLRYMASVFNAPAVTPELRRQAHVLDARMPKTAECRRVERRYRELNRLARAVVGCDDHTMAVLIEWLRPFVAAFRSEYTRRGFVSFQGLLVRGADLLRCHPDIRDRLKQRFRLVLVDEFQDTDPLQGEILLYLSERLDRCAQDWRCVEPEPWKLTIVGDDKQSIYLFRGADPEAYQVIADKLTGDRSDNIERLAVNYRARRELVHFVNAIGRRTMHTPPYLSIDPSPACGTNGRIEMMLFPTLTAEAARESEAETVAAWVTEGVRLREFRAGDVALLLRTLGHAHYYTTAFRQRGIEFVIDGEKDFYAAQEVVDLLSLLAAIVDPTDELAVVGVLRSPLGAVSDRELVSLRDAGALSPLDGQNVPETLLHVRVLYDALARLHHRSRRIPARDLLREVLESVPVLEIARATFRGDQAVANVHKLVDAIAAEGSATLSGALADYRRRVHEHEEEAEAALADDELDAVRILSIHKAKGLEFPVVVLADLHREPPRTVEPAVLREWRTGRVGFRCGRLCTRDWIAAHDRYRRIEEAEALRVLYVALTRAKDRLLLTGGKPETGLLGVVVSALREEGLHIGAESQQALRGDGFEVVVHIRERTARSLGSRREVGPAWEPDYERECSDWAARDAAARQIAQMPQLRHPSISPDRRGDPEPPRVREWELDRSLRLGRDDHDVQPLSVGSRCHSLLATMDLAQPESMVADRAVRAILEPFFMSAAFREIQRAERVYREVPFVVELDGEVWSGQIDVLYCLDGRWVVADYKSDREERPDRHRAQARLYARAAQKALALPRLPESRFIYLRTGHVVRA